MRALIITSQQFRDNALNQSSRKEKEAATARQRSEVDSSIHGAPATRRACHPGEVIAIAEPPNPPPPAPTHHSLTSGPRPRAPPHVSCTKPSSRGSPAQAAAPHAALATLLLSPAPKRKSFPRLPQPDPKNPRGEEGKISHLRRRRSKLVPSPRRSAPPVPDPREHPHRRLSS
uniref:Uncharacterized protein n=1 Tax=Aegilops tauschii subsp. strangulata TaxID=200361 RepID=A0A453SGP4_AEGTS